MWVVAEPEELRRGNEGDSRSVIVCARGPEHSVWAKVDGRVGITHQAQFGASCRGKYNAKSHQRLSQNYILAHGSRECVLAARLVALRLLFADTAPVACSSVAAPCVFTKFVGTRP